ncbi:MAG: hypothetical protein V4667_10245 [Bacteroidota bacterium]
MKYLLLLLSVLSLASCKKSYKCSATANNETVILECKNCSKADVDAYQKEIETAGYTDVTCEN